MNHYPTCCMAIHCGNILCTGCPNRPLLAAFHDRNMTREAYEHGQAKLTEDKVNMTGAFAHLRIHPELTRSAT